MGASAVVPAGGVSQPYYNYTFAPTQSQLGQNNTTYRFGAKGTSAFDCSGAVSYGIIESGINPNFPIENTSADDFYNKYTLPGAASGVGTVNFYTSPGSDTKTHVTTNIEGGQVTHGDYGKSQFENVSQSQVAPYFSTMETRQLNWEAIINAHY